MRIRKKLLSMVLVIVMLTTICPTALATGVAENEGIPSAAWRMETVPDANRSDEQPVYKLVGSVTSPKGMQTLDTWITYDNTIIVPVSWEYKDVSIDNTSTTRDTFTVLIKNGRNDFGTMANGWYVHESRTTWEYVLGETSPMTKPLANTDYLEFYFRVAKGMTVEDLNAETFQIYNCIEHSTQQPACTIMDCTGTNTSYHQYNAGSGMTD